MSVHILFILACAVTNCLGGRYPKDESTGIRPELMLRGGVIGVLTGLYAATQGYPSPVSTCLGLWVAAANAFWAVWKWGAGFSSADGRDCRDRTLLSRITNRITGYSQLVLLDEAQAKHWGFVYMCLRGLYQAPLYAGLALALLKPEVLLIGFGCIGQGVCYRLQGYFKEVAPTIARAELLEGALYGMLITLSLAMA